MPYHHTGKELVTAPTEEPITLADAKLQLHIPSGYNDEDALLTRYIKSAREFFEDVTGRALITQEWLYYFNSFPCSWSMDLPKPPLLDVTFLKYYDSVGNLTTLIGSPSGPGGAILELVTTTEPGKIRLVPNGYWPATQSDRFDAVQAQFTCGYGNAAAVPESIKVSLLAIVNYLYENRGEIDLTTFARILKRFKVWAL